MLHALKNFHKVRFQKNVGFNELPRTIADKRKVIARTYLQAKPSVIVKPGRRYGSTWMDRFIQQRQGVNLCDICSTLYGSDLQGPKYSYRIDRTGLKLGDCDGCGGTGHPDTLYPYYPSEKFPQLRLKPNPNFITKGVT